MALINCPECNKEISDKATVCPHCGYGLNSISVITAHKRSNAIPVFLLICFLIGGLICFYKANANNSEMEILKSVLNIARDNIQFNLELSRYKKIKLILLIISGACGLGACISAIIIATNNKHNKQIKSHN